MFFSLMYQESFKGCWWKWRSCLWWILWGKRSCMEAEKTLIKSQRQESIPKLGCWTMWLLWALLGNKNKWPCCWEKWHKLPTEQQQHPLWNSPEQQPRNITAISQFSHLNIRQHSFLQCCTKKHTIISPPKCFSLMPPNIFEQADLRLLLSVIAYCSTSTSSSTSQNTIKYCQLPSFYLFNKRCRSSPSILVPCCVKLSCWQNMLFSPQC